MSKQSLVPDAWDDDWVEEADRQHYAADTEEKAKPSKSERLARHAELNKKLWASADSAETFHFLEAKSEVPLQSDFKPAVKLLSRKPEKKVSRSNNVPGMSQLTIDDDEDDDDEDSAKKTTLSAEEVRQKSQREREEKQRRYVEARERLFGTSTPESGDSTPGTTTPPKSFPSLEPRSARGKGKGRSNRDGSPLSSSAAETSRNRSSKSLAEGGEGRQLYDPDYTVKPDSGYTQRKNQESSKKTKSATDEEQQPIRAPRGPDGSGRGGFGFAGRGPARSTAASS
ncbi:MAG: hypothetical protein M1837_005608 [Sclerophora amabilis]|nr:MAG: hypothetical protein M1837_005608 [Sclerophora amabilis]